ncbi:MAG: aldehyde dehydrogenase family protein, partial [Cytophagaceae bacterium]
MQTAEAPSKIMPRPMFKTQYENYIGGKWVPPVGGEYFNNESPVDGSLIAKMPRSKAADVDLAVDAAHKAFETWGKTSVTERSKVLLQIADVIEQNLEFLARVETVENGKALRETMAADMPLVVDHFRYFAGVIRAEEGSATELNADTLSLIIK